MKRYGDGKHGILPNALGSASLGMNVVVLGMMTYYLTTQTGLSGTLVGMVLLASRVFDGVSDLVAGYIIDRCHFKIGKARPFDLFGIPMWIALVLCFAVPAWSTTGKVIYVFLMYNLCQTVSYTFVSVSGTIRLKKTFTEEKRPNAIAIAGLLTAVLATLAGIILPLLINMLEYQPNGWLIIAGVFAVPGILMTLCMFFFAPEMEPSEDEANREPTAFKDFAKVLFQNKYLVTIILITMAGTMASGIGGNIGTFFYKYVLGDLTINSLIGLVSLLGYLFILLLPIMTKKLGNRKSMLISFSFIIVGSLAKYLNPHSVLLLAVCSVMVLVGTAFCGSISGLVMIDTMKYGMLKTGNENDGVYSAIKGFSDKVANGLAPFLVGVLLDAGGFDGALDTQSTGATNMIMAIFALFPAIIAGIGFLSMLFCNMDKEIERLEAAHKAEEA